MSKGSNRRFLTQAAAERVTRSAATTTEPFAIEDSSIALRICRVDEPRREVWGYAVSGEVGWDGKVLPHEANVAAFDRWMASPFGGNVREGHKPEAVGRVFHWEADPLTERILVGVRISDGAPNTWSKIVDGVLRAFSVNGHALPGKARTVMFEGRDGVARSVRQFDAWDMDELSVVDVPGDRGVGSFTNIVRSIDMAEHDDVVVRARAAIADAETDIAQSTAQEARPMHIEFDRTATPQDIADLVRRALEAGDTEGDEATDVPPTDDAPGSEPEAPTDAPAAATPPEGSADADAASAAADGASPPAADADTEPAGDGVQRDITSAIDGAARGTVTASDEQTDADLARDIMARIDVLIAREALEQAASGESEAWDIAVLNDARMWLEMFADGEQAEANAMVTRRRDVTMDAEVQTALEAINARIDALSPDPEAVQRALDADGEAAQERAALDARIAALEAQPVGGGPLRTIPADLTSAGAVETVLRRLKEEHPSQGAEIDHLLTFHQMREAQSRPVTTTI